MDYARGKHSLAVGTNNMRQTFPSGISHSHFWDKIDSHHTTREQNKASPFEPVRSFVQIENC